MKILIAGVGNILRGDDGFGNAVIARLNSLSLPAHVKTSEFGIAGIRLVQELMDGYDALIIVDAMQGGGAPGTLYVIEPQLPVITDANEMIGDLHQAEPYIALTMAKALRLLPARVTIIGCEPAEYDELKIGLSPAVERAVARAVSKIEQIIADSQSC